MMPLAGHLNLKMNQYTTTRHRAPRDVQGPQYRCYVCRWFSRPRAYGRRNGRQFTVCLSCLTKYHDPVGQAERFGRKFRFVEKTEIPHPDGVGITERSTGFMPWHPYHDIYKFLLLFKERQEKLGKEVMWMPEEMTQKVLKLPKRVAAAMKNTYAIRGDDATDSDDVALQKIKDLLEEIDPNIFKDLLRRKKK
jgi:hypothetical protein